MYMSSFSYIDSFSEVWEVPFFPKDGKLGALQHRLGAGHPAVQLRGVRVKPERQESATTLSFHSFWKQDWQQTWLFKQVNKQQFLSAKDSFKFLYLIRKFIKLFTL